eukprot:31470-Pelagococcus_subviridis.AAC.6
MSWKTGEETGGAVRARANANANANALTTKRTELEDFAASPPLCHPRDAVPHAYRPVLDLHDAHGAAVRIVVTVQQQRAQRRVRPVRVRVGQSGRVVVSLRQSRAAAWRRHRVDDRAQDVRAPHPGLRADRQDVVGVDPERAQHLFLDAVHVRVVHVHLRVVPSRETTSGWSSKASEADLKGVEDGR